jgi:glucuronoarabinoxylan endo-1,4-beta-xylanase
MRRTASRAKGVAVALLGLAGLAAGGCIRRATAPQPALAAGPAPIAVSVTLSPAERHQTLEGFGASLAWHLDQVVGNPPPGIYQAIFPDLGLDILRLRNRYQRSKPEDGDLSQEVEILRRATQALGHAPKIMLSSWSPPAPLKADHREDCNGNLDCTLARENGQFVYDKFAAYWADSLRHYATLGIVPDYITLENELSFIPPSWEGCKFDPTETAQYPGFDRALAAVYARLAARSDHPAFNPAKPPKILAPEVLGIHWGLLQKYLDHMDMSLVDGVAHHLYERGPDNIWDWRSPGPDSFVDEMQAAAAATSKPLYQTEFQTDEDKGIDGGLETAWLIHHSLVEEGVVAFLYWDLIWTGRGGLVSVNGGNYHMRDQYYSLKHYARFTDPGFVRIGAKADQSPVRASAFVSPAGDQITVVLLNTGSVAAGATANVVIDAGGFAFARAATYVTTYRPGASRVWQDAGTGRSAADIGRNVTLPPRSIATVVLWRSPGAGQP